MLFELSLIIIIVGAGYLIIASVAGFPHRCKHCKGKWHGTAICHARERLIRVRIGLKENDSAL